MKRKLCFVTNSSSTSFMLATLNEESLLRGKLTIEINLVDNVSYFRSFKTIEELDEYYNDEYGMPEDERLEDADYLKAVALIKEGKVVHTFYASDEDGPIEAMICRHGIKDFKFSDDVVIIRGEGGY